MKLFKSKNHKIKATNKSLYDLFANINLIQIKRDGMYEDKALSNDIVLTINEPSKIENFKKKITINEPKEDFHCMCLGDYAIELLNDNEIKYTIGFHHGVSIRFNQWTGDAELRYPDQLLELLFDLGLKEPLEQKRLAHEHVKESEKEMNSWLANSPKSFSKYWDEINDFDESYIPKLKNDLKREFDSEENLITALLKSFGTSNNLWSAYPVYESISQKLLNEYELQDIINVFIASDKEQVSGIGLGRYLFSWDFRIEIKKHKDKLSAELLEFLLFSFQEINDSKGIESIEKIKNNN